MDVHPLFVHFPIALLFVWSLIEISQVHRWIKSVDWKSAKGVLLTVGTVGAYFAKETGEIARDQVTKISPTLAWHETFAKTTFALYFLFLVEIILTVCISQIKNRKISIPHWTHDLMSLYQKIIGFLPIRLPLVVIALTVLTVTGVLGGTLVYGNSADPIAPYVLSILGIR